MRIYWYLLKQRMFFRLSSSPMFFLLHPINVQPVYHNKQLQPTNDNTM